MGFLPNMFSDPALRTRQDQLDAQWSAANAVWQTCDNTPDSEFAEFVNDLKNWRTFYASESDWSSDSYNATNEWQTKLKGWTDKFAQWGCTGNQSDMGLPTGIPGVKDAPPDKPSLLDSGVTAVTGGVGGLLNSLSTLGWVAVGLVVFLVVGAIYLLTNVKVSSPQGSIG